MSKRPSIYRLLVDHDTFAAAEAAKVKLIGMTQCDLTKKEVNAALIKVAMRHLGEVAELLTTKNE